MPVPGGLPVSFVASYIANKCLRPCQDTYELKTWASSRERKGVRAEEVQEGAAALVPLED